MLESDISKNSSQKYFVVLRGALYGFRCPKDAQTPALLAILDYAAAFLDKREWSSEEYENPWQQMGVFFKGVWGKIYLGVLRGAL